MDKEYLEDYEQNERNEQYRFFKAFREGEFPSGKERYPSDERFVNLQKPVALTTLETLKWGRFWAQVPFCGSLIIRLPPWNQSFFEEAVIKVSEIPELVDFIKQTGKLQIVLNTNPCRYEGLDYLEPIFRELNPPFYIAIPFEQLASETEIKEAFATFDTLASLKFYDFMMEYRQKHMMSVQLLKMFIEMTLKTYIFLKLQGHAVAEDFEDLLIDDPQRAIELCDICTRFIRGPETDMRSDLFNFTLRETRESETLSTSHRPQKIRFPYEIGRFLLSRLTYAPSEMRACNELIDHYDAYDLQKLLESFNEAIIKNNHEIINRNAEELSQILDNVWNDKKIPRRVKGLQIGIPLSMAAIGSVAAGPIGTLGGFLAGLGYTMTDKFIDLGTERLSERLAKLKTKSYQANIYDFKKKYKGRIVPS